MSAKRRSQFLCWSICSVFVAILVLHAYDSIRLNRLNMDLRGAVSNGDALQVKNLLSRGADPNCGGFGDAQNAMRNSLVGKVFQRFERQPAQPSLSRPLICASVISHTFHVFHAHTDGWDRGTQDLTVLQTLLDAGADVNASETGGFTAVIRAVQGGDTEAVRLLLSHGARVEAKESVTGRTALQWASDADVRKKVAPEKLEEITTLLQHAQGK